MFINMLAFTDCFYGSVCHVCKRTGNEDNIILKVCSGCKLFSYCSYVHQKDHWPIHKEFCRCIQTILKRTGGNHVFQEANEASIVDHKEWNKYRTSLIQLGECIMKRPLQPLEQQVFLFPPVCNVCRNYKPAEMIPCGNCYSVTYCSLKHKVEDFTPHYPVCTLLKQCFIIDIHLSKYHDVSPYPSITTKVISNDYIKLPENMEKFVKHHATFSSPKCDKSLYLASEILSCPLTVLHVMERFLCEAEISKKDLTLHIVGADTLELCALKTWEILFHRLPHLRYLHIVLIGPGLMNVDVFQKPLLCSLCGKNRKLDLDFKPNFLYHDYIMSNECCIPDMVIAFNCGLCEFEKVPEKDLWKNSISSLLHFPSSLIVLTSYCKDESDHDISRVVKLKKGNSETKILLKGEKNHFASFSPHRDWELKPPGCNNSAVFYINNYISVIQT